MGNGMDKILPGLYVGNFRDAKDDEQLNKHNITHIVAVHDNAKKIHEDKEYLCILASDSPSQDLTSFFPTCNDFIHEARLKGGGVLIHCLAGVSRSVTIAVAYMMSITSLSWREALNAVRSARTIANPNFGFQKQLQEYDFHHLEKERQRLKEKFPITSFNDEAECKKLLQEYNNFVRNGDREVPLSTGTAYLSSIEAKQKDLS